MSAAAIAAVREFKQAELDLSQRLLIESFPHQWARNFKLETLPLVYKLVELIEAKSEHLVGFLYENQIVFGNLSDAELANIVRAVRGNDANAIDDILDEAFYRYQMDVDADRAALYARVARLETEIADLR